MDAYGYPLVNGGLMVVNGGFFIVFDGDLPGLVNVYILRTGKPPCY